LRTSFDQYKQIPVVKLSEKHTPSKRKKVASSKQDNSVLFIDIERRGKNYKKITI